MRKEWVRYLCDPIDKTNLKIDKIFKINGSNILFGTLRSESGNIYSIKEGVPILLNRHTQPVRTVDSFAYEWEQFDFDYGKKGWQEDVVRPSVGGLKYFKNKVIVDCGAGSGQQSLWMAQAGAKFVFSLELSNAAQTIIKKVTERYQDKIFVIQGDLAHLPINKKFVGVDLIYCVNVIQHTENPQKTLSELSLLLRPESEFLFNIYLKRKNLCLINLVQLLKKIMKEFPNSLIKLISLMIAITTYPLKLTKHSFRESWLDVYDLLGSHSYQEFYSEKDVAKMLTKSRLKIVKRSHYAMILKKINFSV